MINVVSFILLYAYSYILISNYTLGDQEHYRKLYELFSETNFSSILLIAPNVIGSSEPVSLFILWLGSVLGIDKDLYISLWNSILLIGLLKLSQKHKLGWLFIVFILSNFYIVVLLTGAERLKFAFIFIIYFYLFYEKKILNVSFLILAVLSHFQTLLFIFGVAAYSLLGSLKILIFKKKIKTLTFVLISLMLILIAMLIIYFGEIMFLKVQYYFLNHDTSLASFIKLLILLLVALLATGNRGSMALMVLSFIPVIYVLGGERVNMIVFMLVLFTLITEGKAKKPIFMVLMAYFTAKSYGFVYNIFTHGNGFMY